MRTIISTVILLTLLVLSGCGQKNNSVPKAIVKPENSSVTMPKATDVKFLDIASDGAASIWMVPNDPAGTIKDVLNWLKTAKPVYVQLPKSKSHKQWATSAYTGPSTLFLHLKDKKIIVITPAYYIWVTNSGFSYHYLNDVIEYKIGNKKRYFIDSVLYKWLKQDKWKQGFTYQ